MKIVILILVLVLVSLPIYAETEQELQSNHNNILAKNSWLLQGKHHFMSFSSLDGKNDSLGSVYCLKNAFSVYRKLATSFVHTKAILSVKNTDLSMNVIHQIESTSLEYTIQLGFGKGISLNIEATNHKERIEKIIIQRLSFLLAEAKNYIALPNEENCLRICSAFLGIDLSIMCIENNRGGSIDGNHLSHGWLFNSDYKLPSVKEYASNIVITFQHLVIYENRMNASVACTGVGSNQSIVYLTDWSHPVPANPGIWYVKGGLLNYYSK